MPLRKRPASVPLDLFIDWRKRAEATVPDVRLKSAAGLAGCRRVSLRPG